MWEYTVGHGQLLLRSPKNEELRTRIDVLFKNVGAIELPTVLDGLTVSEATEGDWSAIGPRVDQRYRTGRTLFVVRGSSFLGYVLAGFVNWHEDEAEYYEASQILTRPGAGEATKEAR